MTVFISETILAFFQVLFFQFMTALFSVRSWKYLECDLVFQALSENESFFQLSFLARLTEKCRCITPSSFTL